MIIINRYTCPIQKTTSIQAHKLDNDFNVVKSFNKQQGDDISLFKMLDDSTILINDVSKASMLDKINIIKV